MAHRGSTAVAAASFLLLTGAGIAAAPAASAGTPGGTYASDRNSDFNGDGYDDVLTGAPGGTDGGHKGAGYVTVQYGGVKGIGTATGTHRGRTAVFGQATSGVPGGAEPGDGFGTTVETGDLDADGYDDAIVAAPGEDFGSLVDAGRVTVLYGSAEGLRATRSVTLQAAAPKAHAGFGLAVAAARFTGATPGDVLAVADLRGVDLFTHGTGSLKGTGRVDTTGAPGGDAIRPAALTTGNYDADGYADLIVSGQSLEEDGTGRSAVYTGGADGLAYARDLGGGPATASGDINDDGYDDLVYGRPDRPDDHHEPLTGGVVGVYFGGEEGVRGVDEHGTVAQVWTQDVSGVPGTGELGDGFGADLSLADVDGDGYDDLAVGAPGEDIGAVADAGAVWLLRGSAAGLTAAGAKSFDQNSAGVPGTVERADRWGGQVRLADTDGDGRAAMLAAAPGENTSDGGIWVLPAATTGTVAAGSWSYGAGSLRAPGGDARFGAAINE
ncbi:FG-GAP repeat protein [Streptomyces sp. ISL-22]|uniref:integrin alpha n=1 Tax=unclassified Streptomyces TaxID=2593676 RepID=UPI001BE51925|nr:MULTISPECIES: integrin alpha [unclassified Streptomyces]MBT2420429.1 FG-GAP repeat protein [Streptomyces sp. ISL-24]MBT2435015.1 FG-GAP repeat protein [Streptomyces sp. ISL-22]